MIIGIGIDLVNSQRIEKMLANHPKRFVEKHFTQAEQDQAKTRQEAGTMPLFYAKRFAAKEAFVKALGTGFRDHISFQHIEIYNDKRGKPYIRCSGKTEEVLKEQLPSNQDYKVHLSLSDEPPYAIAKVIVEAI